MAKLGQKGERLALRRGQARHPRHQLRRFETAPASRPLAGAKQTRDQLAADYSLVPEGFEPLEQAPSGATAA